MQTTCSTSGEVANISGSGLDSSLDDLNREVQNFCPYDDESNGNNLEVSEKVVRPTYCDIFSRKPIQYGDSSSPGFDDENRLNFRAGLPDSDCELILPKRPSKIVIPIPKYHPNANVQISKSSCSAFRDISQRSKSEDDSKSKTATAINPSTSKSKSVEEKADEANGNDEKSDDATSPAQ